MKRWIAIIAFFVLLMGSLAVFGFQTAAQSSAELDSVNAMMTQSSALQTRSALGAEQELPTATATSTPTETASPSPTASMTSTPTATLATLVLNVRVMNPDVMVTSTANARTELAPLATSTPLPTIQVPTPPRQLAPVVTGTTSSVSTGWVAYTIDNSAIVQSGKWERFTFTYRSADRQYLYTDTPNSSLSLRFLGAAVRIRYAAYDSYGVFQVRIDGKIVSTIDSYYPHQSDGRGNFLSTDVFGLAQAWHTVEILHSGRKIEMSKGTFVAIDGIDIYSNGNVPTLIPTNAEVLSTPTPAEMPIKVIRQIVAPPTIQPTITTAPPNVIAVRVSMAYDANNNHAIDPSEGVQGVVVRLVTSDTNRVVASGTTNADGFVRIEATSTVGLRLVIPYLNRFWEIPAKNRDMQISLLLPSVNMPGLIP